ncbi:MAG: hypothetical protein ACREVV_14935 [Steroidobacteraceae bacterium]
MSGSEREDEFEAYLRHRSVLPGGVPGSQRLEPPEDLDAVVLRKAREAIRAPARMPVYRAPRWALPVALAATILLSFSILLNVSVIARKPPGSLLDSAAKSSAAPAPPSGRNAPALEASTSALKSDAPASRADVAVPEVRIPSREATLPPPPPANDLRKKSASAAARDPAAWLKQIDLLRAQGKTAEADEELRRFREAFPHYPVKPGATSASGPPK